MKIQTGTSDNENQGMCTDMPIAPHLSFWGCVSIIVGIVVGVSIFKAPALVFNNVQTPWIGMAAWVAGGVLSLIGALCYIELATTYPHMGGDYTYLSRAYHPYVGYLFGWSRLAVMQTGSIGALAYVLADYAVTLLPGLNISPAWIAALSVVALTLINILGIRCGKTTQNLLTALKIAALLGIVAAGLFMGHPDAFQASGSIRGPGLGLAMILILYSYGGWSEAAFVAAEMRDHRRDIPRALIFSIGAIIVVYLVINLAFLLALGFEGVRNSSTPAADVLGLALGPWGMRIMSMVVILSALGALNGTILTGSRVYAAMGVDHRFFSFLGRWSPRLGTPVWSLVAQGIVTLLMILAVGTAAGRFGLDRMLMSVGLERLPWDSYGGGFDTLVAGAAPVFWAFMLLTSLAVIVLRIRDKHIPRPCPTPLYPFLPLVFSATCIYMLYSSYQYARGLLFFGLLLVVIGMPLYYIGRKKRDRL